MTIKTKHRKPVKFTPVIKYIVHIPKIKAFVMPSSKSGYIYFSDTPWRVF